MKFLILIVLTLSASTAFAGRQTYVCHEIGGTSKMILTQMGLEKVEDGGTYAFELKVVKGSKTIAQAPVTVTVEDVMFQFSNASENINGTIYLDELDQTWLNLGKEDISFDCH